MKEIEQAIQAYEDSLKEHHLMVYQLVNLGHIPENTRLMELKATIRSIQKITSDAQANLLFLNRSYQKVVPIESALA